MGYTNPWSTVIPAGGTNANLIDNHIRQVRLDLEERLLGIFNSMAADPVTVRDDVKGAVVGKQLVISPFGFTGESGSITAPTDLYVGPALASCVFLVPLLLPVGISITKFEILSDKQTSASVIGSLQKNSFVAAIPGISVLSTLTNNTAGINMTASGVLALTVGLNETWYIKVTIGAPTFGNPAGRYYGARLTYNTTDSRNTI